MRAGPFDDLPGTYRLVGSSSWIRCTGTAPMKTPKASGNCRFPARPNLVLRVHGWWGDPASEPKVLAKEIRRVAAAFVAPGSGQTAGLADAQAASPHPPTARRAWRGGGRDPARA